MLELININQEKLNSKDRITIDLIKAGQDFLKKFEIKKELLHDTISIIYKFLKRSEKIPHNLYKFFVAAYYMISRHPISFPNHEPKKKFCQVFGIQSSSLDYSVERLVKTLNFVKILDDNNYPYYFNPSTDLGFKIAKRVIIDKVERAMMDFLLSNQPINTQILSEELTTKIIFEMEIFPEELLRQFYNIIHDLIEAELKDYNEYVQLQLKYFI